MILPVNDFALGRMVRAVGRRLLPVLNNPVTVAANRHRIRIDLTNLTASFSSAIVVQVDGISSFILPRGENSDVSFTLSDHGDLPTKSFVISTTSATALPVGVVEHFLPESYLAAGLEEFKREHGIWQK